MFTSIHIQCISQHVHMEHKQMFLIVFAKLSSRVTQVTLVLLIGNKTLRESSSSFGNAFCMPKAVWPLREGREIWGVDGVFAGISWHREYVGAASRHQPMNWLDSIRASDNRHAEGVPKAWRAFTQRKWTYDRERIFFNYLVCVYSREVSLIERSKDECGLECEALLCS